ncbi:MAG TPA: L,D-transpeptidase [Candidatus Saccharimonadales bacterium]|nr:L,D-transpeptidase [Candidatus Saccharimonadales bacterium]
MAIVVVAIMIGYRTATSPSTNNADTPLITTSPTNSAKSDAPVVAPSQAIEQSNPCEAYATAKYIMVSISKRHLWACQAHKQAYDSPIITGYELFDATKTPTGTYKIYGKHTNVTLKGSDQLGSWNDPVHYWMPFLNNKYGEYGFHDATWRPGNPFGAVDPDTKDASHGCVELPLSTAAWIYGWAAIGTSVTIES